MLEDRIADYDVEAGIREAACGIGQAAFDGGDVCVIFQLRGQRQIDEGHVRRGVKKQPPDLGLIAAAEIADPLIRGILNI